MGYDIDMPRRLKLAGLIPDFVDGWSHRGSADYSAVGHINHHTAGGPTGTQPSLNICVNGRSDLPGPLCNIFVPREETGRVIVVAAGRANHGGKGEWLGISGNSRFSGVEVEHRGTAAEGLSPLRYDVMVRVAAALSHGRNGARMVCQHREYALPRGRKPDFTSVHIPDGEKFRQDVQAMMNHIIDGTVPLLGSTPGGGVVLPPQPGPQPGVPILRRGSKGDAVRHVQNRLNAHSVNDGRLKVSVDGDFGPGTEKAVKAFQEDVRLPQDGVVGPQTLSALNTTPNPPQPPPNPNAGRPLLRRGARGEHVRHLQNRLNAHGIKTGVDGDFGPGTERSVKAFQKAKGLSQDGIVGPGTWKALG